MTPNAAWGNALFIDHAILRLGWRNWGVVAPGRLYRSNHPLPWQLRQAARRHGIRTNAVAPGPFPTKGAWSRLVPGELMEKFDMAQRVPLGRLGEHQELADLVAYLISPYSGYVNGEVVTIDGGEWLKGAGQFNMLEMVEPGMWDAIEQMVRGAKGS